MKVYDDPVRRAIRDRIVPAMDDHERLGRELEDARAAQAVLAAERDAYLRQRDEAIGERNEFLRQRDAALAAGDRLADRLAQLQAARRARFRLPHVPAPQNSIFVATLPKSGKLTFKHHTLMCYVGQG